MSRAIDTLPEASSAAAAGTAVLVTAEGGRRRRQQGPQFSMRYHLALLRLIMREMVHRPCQPAHFGAPVTMAKH